MEFVDVVQNQNLLEKETFSVQKEDKFVNLYTYY